jgi:hypothetical protein
MNASEDSNGNRGILCKPKKKVHLIWPIDLASIFFKWVPDSKTKTKASFWGIFFGARLEIKIPAKVG